MRRSRSAREGRAAEAAKRLSQLSHERLDVLTHALRLDDNAMARWLTRLMKAAAQRRGARFHFQAKVVAVTPQARPELRLSALAALPFDAIVVRAGAGAAALLQQAGLRQPLLPVYGYWLMAAIRHCRRPAGQRAGFGRHRCRVGCGHHAARGAAARSRPCTPRPALRSARTAGDVVDVHRARPLVSGCRCAAGGVALEKRAASVAGRPASHRREQLAGDLARHRAWRIGLVVGSGQRCAKLTGGIPPADGAPCSPARWH